MLAAVCRVGVCAAQQALPQFVNMPRVEPTGGEVQSFVAGTLQSTGVAGGDIVYVNAPVVVNGVSQVTVGALLSGQGFTNSALNQITFQHATKVVAALGDFNSDGLTDAVFAITPDAGSTIQICVYYGTGAAAGSGQRSFVPIGPESGCIALPAATGKGPLVTPHLDYIVPFPLQPGAAPQLLLEDSANNILYMVSALGKVGSTAGHTASVSILEDGAGPIFVGDFDGDGQNDFIVNSQATYTADVYLGAGGLHLPSERYAFDRGVHSILVQDVDGDGIADLVVEGSDGNIEIFKGAHSSSNSFATVSEGGTPAGSVGPLAGVGGHLAAIDPTTLDILTTTPIGLSVLEKQSGTLSYELKGIYNIGPGRESFALADFFGAGNMDLAVNSAEGVAVIAGNPDGSFQTEKSYTALAPALSAATGKFRNAQNNPKGNLDMVVATGATQGRLLTGNGDGTFGTFSETTDATGGLGGIPANVWSNVVSGDFNGDGIADIAYTLTGLPAPELNAPGMYVQLGSGDGTFQAPMAVTSAAGNNNFFGESVVGDFNGDGLADIANIDAGYDDTLLGQRAEGPMMAGLNDPETSHTAFSLVAAGYFKSGRTNKQDLVFEKGANFVPHLSSGDGLHYTIEPALAGTPPVFALVPSAMLLTDVDGDGNGDVVVVYYPVSTVAVGPAAAPAGVYIWWGNGDGTFSSLPQVITLSRNYYLAAVGDMNGDGLPDIVLSDGSVVSILYNQGGRSFGAVNAATGLVGNEQHFLAGQRINAILLADVNGDGRPDVIAANGGVTVANAIALGGATASSLVLTPNPDVNTGGITVLVNHITASPVTGMLAASPEPSIFDDAFTLTATITPSAGEALPTGTMQFAIDGADVGAPVAVAPGTASSTATYTVAAGNNYTAGIPHTLSAVYSGDAVNAGITLFATHDVVGGPTTSQLFICIGPTVACPSTGAINPPPTYIAALQMLFGQTWNGTMDAFANGGSLLTGTISLMDDYNGVTSTLCTLQVSSGGACSPSVGTTVGTGVGVHILTAAYSGDTNHTASSSQMVTITVLQDTTTATLAGAPNPSPAGQPVTFTATLTGNAAAPMGTVTFAETFPPTSVVQPLGTATLVPGAGLSSTATLTTSALPLGTDTITASYAATTDFAAATATTTETITPSLAGSFTLTMIPNPVGVEVGFGNLLSVTVTPASGFSQAVNLACGALPTEMTCLFPNATIAAGGGPVTLILQTTAPHSCRTNTPYFEGENGGFGGRIFGRGGFAALPALAGLIALFVPGRRRWLRLLVALIAVTGAMQMSGCGNCTDLGTRPATYTIQVTGTAAGSGEVQSASVTANVVI